MKNYEYALFYEDNPVQVLKDDCKSLAFMKKRKGAPYIKRAEQAARSAKAWRKFITDQSDTTIGVIFMLYFETKIDKGTMMYMPKDPALEFMMFFTATTNLDDDKYLKKARAIIRSYSDSIDYFIKAFLSIRIAKEEFKKLQAS